MKYDTLLEVAKSGIAAPSADNQHVFRIGFSESSIQLYPTQAFTSTTERHRHVLGLLSLGAVVENMRLKSRELGFDTEVHWFPSDGKRLADIKLIAMDEVPASDLGSAIQTRHTNRRMYSGPALSADELSLLNAAAMADGVQLVWLQGDAKRIALKMIWLAESERFLRQRLHEEIFSSIRFDLSWSETSELSLPPGALEIEPPMRPMFKALRHWKLMRPLSWLGVHRALGLRAGWLPAWQAPALGVLTTSMSADQGAPDVGAAFQRLWLRATILELALQPLAASAVLPLQSNADCGASESLRLALKTGWASITPHTPLMVFRIGRAAPPTIRASRQAFNDYLHIPQSGQQGG